MNTSISVVCYKSKTLSNGENPLMIQVSKNGKRKYQSLGISIKPKFWDFTRNKPKPNCPNGEYIQQIILNKTGQLQKQALELNAIQKEFTPNILLTVKQSDVKEKTVGEFYRELIQHYKQVDKVGNRLIYKGSYNSIKEFSKGRLNILFTDIDVKWLQRYERWLVAKGNKETTISLLFRTLRSAYNKAIEEKAAKKSTYPFYDYKISKFNVKTKKRAITKDEILKIMQLDLTNENESIKFARDIFIFSYLCGGINFTDIANLKPENIISNKLQYIRQKTGKEISLVISQVVADLINIYCTNQGAGYIFPILNLLKHKTELQKQNRIHKILVKVNKDLKRIAELANVDFNLSTYVARHSFATVLKNSGVNIALISEALGHSDLSTTQIYLDSFESEQINEAMKNLV